MTKRSGKQKNDAVQGEYDEIFQPDSDTQLWVLAELGLFIVLALIGLAEGVMADDTATLVLGIVMAGLFIGVGAREAMKVHWNHCLAFAVTPEKLTLLWNGQPVKVIPWGKVMEVFVTAGPCELRDSHRSYGVYISVQYGYESRLYKAKRQILNLHISPDSLRHLEDFPVMRICIGANRKSCQRLVSRFEGYRNAAWAREYEEKHQ